MWGSASGSRTSQLGCLRCWSDQSVVLTLVKCNREGEAPRSHHTQKVTARAPLTVEAHNSRTATTTRQVIFRVLIIPYLRAHS